MKTLTKFTHGISLLIKLIKPFLYCVYTCFALSATKKTTFFKGCSSHSSVSALNMPSASWEEGYLRERNEIVWSNVSRSANKILMHSFSIAAESVELSRKMLIKFVLWSFSLTVWTEVKLSALLKIN